MSRGEEGMQEHGEGGEEEEGGRWLCEYCTYENLPKSGKCTMCRCSHHTPPPPPSHPTTHPTLPLPSSPPPPPLPSRPTLPFPSSPSPQAPPPPPCALHIVQGREAGEADRHLHLDLLQLTGGINNY